MVTLGNGTTFDGIAFCFKKYFLPAYPWLSNVLNIFYGKQMPAAKYNSLFTDNTKTDLKANVLMLIDEWILDEVQMACDHGAGSGEARAMKDLVKMDRSPLCGIYSNGDYANFDNKDDLINYMNHVSVDVNHHNILREPSQGGK